MLFPPHLPFGDMLPAIKHDSSLQIGFCNNGRFPPLAKNNPKVSDIKAFIASHNLDIFGGCESNLNWTTLPEHTQLKEWFCMADSCQTLVVHNTHENFGRSQYRGTFWIAVGHASCHISSSDCDPSKLGCWVSCTLCGRSGKKLHIIFAYRPCSNSSSQLRSIFAQHKRYFDSLPWYTNPHQAFLDDLGAFIAQHQVEGNAIILFANMNGDICHHTIEEFTTTHHLHELLLAKFPHLPLPATFQRGQWLGMVPTDGVWAMDDLSISSISWRDIISSPGYHWAIILNLNLLESIGEPCYTIVHPPGHQLNCSLPSTQAKYLQLLEQYVTDHNLLQKLDNLFFKAKDLSTTKIAMQASLESFNLFTTKIAMQAFLESFNRLKLEGMKHAENKCQRFHTGLVQFSPELNLWHKHQDLW